VRFSLKDISDYAKEADRETKTRGEEIKKKYESLLMNDGQKAT